MRCYVGCRYRFPMSAASSRCVIKRLQHPIYGYPFVTPDFYEATTEWVEKRHGWKLDPKWLVFATGIVPVFNTMIQALSEEGDKIIISRPVYHPFGFAVEDNHREISDNSLIYEMAIILLI